MKKLILSTIIITNFMYIQGFNVEYPFAPKPKEIKQQASITSDVATSSQNQQDVVDLPA